MQERRASNSLCSGPSQAMSSFPQDGLATQPEGREQRGVIVLDGEAAGVAIHVNLSSIPSAARVR